MVFPFKGLGTIKYNQRWQPYYCNANRKKKPQFSGFCRLYSDKKNLASKNLLIINLLQTVPKKYFPVPLEINPHSPYLRNPNFKPPGIAGGSSKKKNNE
jgi:hypothetical protein